MVRFTLYHSYKGVGMPVMGQFNLIFWPKLTFSCIELISALGGPAIKKWLKSVWYSEYIQLQEKEGNVVWWCRFFPQMKKKCAWNWNLNSQVRKSSNSNSKKLKWWYNTSIFKVHCLKIVPKYGQHFEVIRICFLYYCN